MLRSLVTKDDLGRIEGILRSSNYFYDHEIDIAKSLVLEHLNLGVDSPYNFLFSEGSTAYACYGEVPCTKGTYDLYWIAVENKVRNQGLGGQLLQNLEADILNKGGRLIFIETSERDIYHTTRDFYLKYGYKVVGFYPNFYDKKDGKFVFSKSLV